jgi:hypothetical protein
MAQANATLVKNTINLPVEVLREGIAALKALATTLRCQFAAKSFSVVTHENDGNFYELRFRAVPTDKSQRYYKVTMLKQQVRGDAFIGQPEKSKFEWPRDKVLAHQLEIGFA